MNAPHTASYPQFPPEWAHLRVAIAHDWLTGMRGGEKVLELLSMGFPQAPVYTLIHRAEKISQPINRHDIRTSWLQRLPGVHRYYRYLLPFFPYAIGRFPAPDQDILISSSHCVAKGLRIRSGARHLCYCYTPMRYAWQFFDEYFGRQPLKKWALQPLLSRLRRWDRTSSIHVNRFVAISEHVRRRIQMYYERDADVVYPPVATHFYTLGTAPRGDFDLVVSALVPYKRVDLAVAAYNASGRNLKIVGTGTEYDRLVSKARPNIEFLGWCSDEKIRDLYRRACLLVFPGEEDFGIVPVEAMACGTPVVAYRRGGVLETVTEGISGLFFDEQNAAALQAAVETCARRTWDPLVLSKQAGRFSAQRFIDGFAGSLQHTLEDRP